MPSSFPFHYSHAHSHLLTLSPRVQKLVGNKPALLGRKLTQRYYTAVGKPVAESDYLEVDCDVGSSMIADRVSGWMGKWVGGWVVVSVEATALVVLV